MVKKARLLIFSLLLCSCLGAAIPARNNHSRSNLMPSNEQFQLKQEVLSSVFIPAQELYFFSNSRLLNLSATSPKKKGRAFLQSLLLPGWGQHYADSKSMMKVFIATEVLLWGSYFGFQTWGNWLEDDYRTFAVQHARVDLDGKPDGYLVDVSNFDDIFAYNQEQLRNRDLGAVYTDTDAFFWQWDEVENRRKFDDLRLRSDRAGNRASLAAAFIFTNHLISAIHSTLAVFKFNERLKKQGLGFNIHYGRYPENRSFKIALSKTF